jgi:hypothetical protein
MEEESGCLEKPREGLDIADKSSIRQTKLNKIKCMSLEE